MRKIENRMFKINTYASCFITEETNEYTEAERLFMNNNVLDVYGWKLELFMYIADLTIKGYAIQSVTEYNSDGTKPKIGYANDKDFKKILKWKMGEWDKNKLTEV